MSPSPNTNHDSNQQHQIPESSLISFKWHPLESQLCLYSRQTVMSLQDTVDKSQHRMCRLEFKTTEKQCQTIFNSFSWNLNTASIMLPSAYNPGLNTNTEEGSHYLLVSAWSHHFLLWCLLDQLLLKYILKASKTVDWATLLRSDWIKPFSGNFIPTALRR